MNSRRRPLSIRPGSLPPAGDRGTSESRLRIPDRHPSEARLRVPEMHASESKLRAASARPADSSPAAQLARVRTILRSYLSPIMVDSVLEKALGERGVSPRRLSAGELAEVTSDIMVGLRLFVSEERLPQLMLELVEVLEGGTS